jgi:serine/threonine-protein kinase
LLQDRGTAHDRVVKICPACSREYGDEHSHCRDDGVVLVYLDTGSNERVQDLIGQVVDGRYRIERIVGRGGMGTVYACRHVVVGKAFAMKVLRPGIERSEEILQRFIREAQAANAVQSRHICGMTDFGQLPSGAFFVVMELLHGMSLTRALRENRLTRKNIKHIFVQVGDTLDKAHRAGIIHRDLKPDNVVLVHDDGDPFFVKLVDFGIAKLIHTKASSLTETGVILGTPYYMSPEQARGDPIDHRSDIYALGVMMFRAFTGKLPFVADTAMGVLTRHLTEKPQLPSRLAEMDPALERVILRCLEKRPIDRFQSMADLADALRSVSDEASSNFNHPTVDERSAPLKAAQVPAPPDSEPTPTKVATPKARDAFASAEVSGARSDEWHGPQGAARARSAEYPPLLTPDPTSAPPAMQMPLVMHPSVSSDQHSVPPGLAPVPSPVPGSMTPYSYDPRFGFGAHDPLAGEAATNRGVVSSRFASMRPRPPNTAVWVGVGVALTFTVAAAALVVLWSSRTTEQSAAPPASVAVPTEEPIEPESDEPLPKPTTTAETSATASSDARVQKERRRSAPGPSPRPVASATPSASGDGLKRPPPEIRSPFEDD